MIASIFTFIRSNVVCTGGVGWRFEKRGPDC